MDWVWCAGEVGSDREAFSSKGVQLIEGKAERSRLVGSSDEAVGRVS